MPIYEYKPKGEQACEYCVNGFEIMQTMSEEPLTACPKCGNTIARAFSAFAMGGKEKEMMSNKNLAEKGFTKYEKRGDGYYEKTAGKGPSVIRR